VNVTLYALLTVQRFWKFYAQFVQYSLVSKVNSTEEATPTFVYLSVNNFT